MRAGKWTLLIALFITGVSTKTVLANESLVGNWQGQAAQPGFGNYPVELNLTRNPNGQLAGYSIYPSLHCHAHLTQIRDEGNRVSFREKVVQGSGCISNGIIVLAPRNRHSLTWQWRYPNGSIGASALVYQKPPSAAMTLALGHSQSPGTTRNPATPPSQAPRVEVARPQAPATPPVQTPGRQAPKMVVRGVPDRHVPPSGKKSVDQMIADMRGYPYTTNPTRRDLAIFQYWIEVALKRATRPDKAPKVTPAAFGYVDFRYVLKVGHIDFFTAYYTITIANGTTSKHPVIVAIHNIRDDAPLHPIYVRDKSFFAHPLLVDIFYHRVLKRILKQGTHKQWKYVSIRHYTTNTHLKNVAYMNRWGKLSFIWPIASTDYVYDQDILGNPRWLPEHIYKYKVRNKNYAYSTWRKFKYEFPVNSYNEAVGYRKYLDWLSRHEYGFIQHQTPGRVVMQQEDAARDRFHPTGRKLKNPYHYFMAIDAFEPGKQAGMCLSLTNVLKREDLNRWSAKNLNALVRANKFWYERYNNVKRHGAHYFTVRARDAMFGRLNALGNKKQLVGALWRCIDTSEYLRDL